MEPLHDIRAFVAIVEQGNQAAAARLLGRSVQSVSRSLALLERSLGVQLIRRTTRRSAPTEIGLAYCRGMQAALAAYDDARCAATSQRANPRGLLRIAAPVQFAPAFVVPLVSAFLAEYPEMSVALSSSDRFVDLIDGDIDLAIRIGALADSELTARRLGAVRIVVAGAPAYFERHGRPARPQDLASHQCLVRTAHENDAQWRFQAQGKPLRVKVAGRFRADTTAAIYPAVLQGLGLCYTPLWQIRELVDAGRLDVVLSDFEQSPIPVNAVWHGARGSVTHAKLFADFAAARLPAAQLSP